VKIPYTKHPNRLVNVLGREYKKCYIGREKSNMSILYTRAQVDSRIRREIAKGRPIFVPNCGCGLTAKLQEMGGADLIVASPTSYWRMKGQAAVNAFLPNMDSNQAVYEILPEITAIVKETPVMTLSNTHNPLLGHKRHLAKLKEYGVSGINPLMSNSYDKGFNERLLRFGIGWNTELEFVKAAIEMDMYTFAYAYNEEEAKILAANGCDIISSHLGQTAGGLVGADVKMTLEAASEITQRVFETARKENPKVILLAHGGPLTSVTDVEYVYKQTIADGFVGGSAAERLPIEKAVLEATKSFKSYSR
jgi:predicted TIM-barrel enzyme